MKQETPFGGSFWPTYSKEFHEEQRALHAQTKQRVAALQRVHLLLQRLREKSAKDVKK
jgi:hypothetical protein